jgi:transposase
MAALGTRAFLQYGEDGYVVPLPMTGEVPALLETLLEPVWNRQQPLERIYDDAEGATKTRPQLLGLGYETSRDHEAQVEGARIRWKERVLVVYAPAHAKYSRQGLERRLERAERARQALTPPLACGRRQWSDETALWVEAEAILKRHHVEGFLEVSYTRQIQQRPVRKYGARSAYTEETVHYTIQVKRARAVIRKARLIMGWWLYVTTAPPDRVSL